MSLLRGIKGRLALFRGREQFENTLDAELQGYLEERIQRKVLDGHSLAEARRQTLLEEGRADQVKEGVRDSRLGTSLETTIRDIRYAVRRLLRAPIFSLTVILTVALGIGANVTMFSIMNAILWRPLPYPAPEKIVFVGVDARKIVNAGAAPGEVIDLIERSRMVERLSVINSVDANLEYGGEIEHLSAASVTDGFLPLLGAEPALGRLFDSRVDGKDLVRAVIISNSLWQRRFAGDPTIIGRNVRINNLEIEIIGVLRPNFRLFLPPSVNASEQVDIWFPSVLERSRQYRGFSLIGRLKPGVTVGQANAELQTIASDFVRERPDAYPDGQLRLVAHPLQDDLTRESRPSLYLLAGAVGFVLLIACVNVANLMLARGAAREREVAIRRAMGAGGARLIRQFLIENGVLALAAGGVGLFLAWLSLVSIVKAGSFPLPMQSRMTPDWALTLFALLLSIGTSLLFGLVPAWRLASGDSTTPLRGGRSETASHATRLLQRGLVVADVALSIVPLACGGLMLHTFFNLTHAPLGFNPAGILTAKLPMNLRAYPTTDERWSLYRDILREVGRLPGVEAASAAAPLPLDPHQVTKRISRSDQPGTAGFVATQQAAMPGYVQVVGTPLLQGRDFTPEDSIAKRPVVIIDQRVARKLFADSALGKRLTVESGGARRELEIIGVIAPVRVTRVRDDDMPHFIVPYHLYPIEMSLVVKARGAAELLGPALQNTVAGLHTGRAIFDIRPMDDYVADSIRDIRFTMLVLGTFAVASVVLASVGLYGTLAYLVSQRKREFGIRLALGCSVRGLVALVVGEGVFLTTLGVGGGLLGAFVATRGIRQLLYGVTPLDSVTLAGVIAIVTFVSIAAASLPAWRVTRIDPNISLRSDC